MTFRFVISFILNAEAERVLPPPDELRIAFSTPVLATDDTLEQVQGGLRNSR